MTGSTLTSIGLVLDIIGAIMLFKFGLPAEVSRGGVINIITEQTDTAEAAKATRYEQWGRFGLGLLILGFLFQLVGNVLNP